jgi:hypothetical protein
MAPHLAAASIRDYLGIVKSVVASAINENGEELFPRKWNEDYIDAPVIDDQRQPTTTSEGVTTIVAKAQGQYQILYALLAGCGPLRVGEALRPRNRQAYLSGLPNTAHHPKSQAW